MRSTDVERGDIRTETKGVRKDKGVGWVSPRIGRKKKVQSPKVYANLNYKQVKAGCK